MRDSSWQSFAGKTRSVGMVFITINYDFDGLGSRNRTCDLLRPRQARYQAALHPDGMAAVERAAPYSPASRWDCMTPLMHAVHFYCYHTENGRRYQVKSAAWWDGRVLRPKIDHRAAQCAKTCRVAQRESTAVTRRGSPVRSRPRQPASPTRKERRSVTSSCMVLCIHPAVDGNGAA